MKKNNAIIKMLSISLITIFGFTQICQAQMKGDHLLGDYGLAAGTQPPPSLIVMVPVYDYNAPKFIRSNGDKLSGLDVNAFLLGAGASVVTNFKILGANYGASVLFAFASNKLEGGTLESKNSLAFSDTYIQPLQLGWHSKQADFTVGYGLYMPTGKYEFMGDDNAGMGMWTNEFSVGTTVYFDKKKTFNFSTIAFYEIHSDKKGTDLKTGDILTLEGGLAKTFHVKMSKTPVPMEINVGPVYYAQYKLTDDKISLDNHPFTGDKDHLYGVGLEANILYPKTFTSFSVRWLTEVGAKNRFEGNTILLTVGQFLASFEKKK